MTTVKIEGLSNTKKGTEVTSLTIAGTFNIGDGINHAFQITLTGNDLQGTQAQQKQVAKTKIRDIIKTFKKQTIITQENSNAWNSDYSEDI